jgi:hypothetical protein
MLSRKGIKQKIHTFDKQTFSDEKKEYHSGAWHHSNTYPYNRPGNYHKGYMEAEL